MLKNLNLKSLFGEFVTLSLLVAAVGLHSPAFAWATVGSLLVGLVAEVVHEKLFAMRNINIQMPDDMRKRISDTETAVAGILHGIKMRGY